jgi:hypothetical protein
MTGFSSYLRKEVFMKKSRILLAACAAVFSLNVHAGNTYVGGSLALQSVSAQSSRFHGWRPGVLIGYGDMLDDDYYLAGEFMYSVAGAISNTYPNRNDSLRLSPGFTFSFIPGMVLTRTTMVYLRLALEVDKVAVSDKSLTGGLLGAGFEFLLTPSWSLRPEVDYTFYRSLSFGTPRSIQVGLSFKYTYDA